LSNADAAKEAQRIVDAWNEPENQVALRDQMMARRLARLGPIEFCEQGWFGWPKIAAAHGLDVDAIRKRVADRRLEENQWCEARKAEWAKRDAELAAMMEAENV
jgi:hypothetical protein